MAANFTYTLITIRDGKYIHGYGWEIKSINAVITNRKLIESKTSAFNSMVHHAKRFLDGVPLKANVKNREVEL